MSFIVRCTVALLAIFVIFSVELINPSWSSRLDEGVRDSFTRLLSQKAVEDRIVIVDIDEGSLEKIGPWPWRRSTLAELVEVLFGNFNARGVGLDIVLPQAGDPGADARIAALAQNAPLTLAQIIDSSDRDSQIQIGNLAGKFSGSPDKAEMVTTGKSYIANHEAFSNARCVGNIGYKPDTDGVLRHLPLRSRFGGAEYPNFALAMLMCENPNFSGPTPSKDGLWRIPFSKAQTAYSVVAASDVLENRLRPELLSDKYIVIGSSALSLGDRVATPISPISSGVLVHAASLSSLLDFSNGVIHQPWSGSRLLMTFGTLTVVLATIVISRYSALFSTFTLLSLSAVWIVIAGLGFTFQVEWSVSAPLFGYLFLGLVAIPGEWWQTQRHGRLLLNTFSHYVAPSVLSEILRLDLRHSLRPTLLEVSVLVADMENYTGHTNSVSLDEAAELTKDFLTCLTKPVINENGTLDKYTGDGLVAFWGAPLQFEDHADMAVEAALRIIEEVEGFNSGRLRQGKKPVAVRIGIESGTALVGDLGTTFRSTYTAVGDCINFASRLEKVAQRLGTRLAIGPVANGMLRKHVTISLGHTDLRGTREGIEVFTVSQTPDEKTG